MKPIRQILLLSLLFAMPMADVARAHETIDNQFIFGRNVGSPPTLSKRVIDTTNRGVFGLSPSDSVIIANSGVAGGTLAGRPGLNFVDVGATGDTITRSTGSWITDGFAAGQAIYVTGTGSNNINRALVTNVSATVLTLGTTALANENVTVNGGTLAGSPNLTFAEVGEYGDTITRSAGSWISDGFKVGQLLTVTSSASNNVTDAYITGVTATIITLGPNDLVTEGPVGGVTVTSRIALKGSDRFVTCQNFGSGTITEGRYANAEGLKIDGNQSVTAFAAADEALSPFGYTHTADGVALDGEFPTAHNLLVKNFRGIGIAHAMPDGRIFDCVVHSCHTGVKLPSSDSEIRGCRIYACRDACLWITKYSGNCQSLNNHCCGARIVCYNEGGSPYRATNDTYADGWVGYLGELESYRSVLTNCLFQHNTARDVVFRAVGGQLIGCTVDVQRDVVESNIAGFLPGVDYTTKVGVEIDTERCSIRGGTVELLGYVHPVHTPTGNPAEAIWVNGDLCTIETVLVDFDGINGSKGIRIKGARSDVKIDCVVSGFHDTNERILVVDDAAHCKDLDITLRVSGITSKSIDDYIDIGSGWTGTIRFINTTTGAVTTFTDGGAH